MTQNGQQKNFGMKNRIQDLITTAKRTNHAPTTNGYKPSAPPSTLIKSHGTGHRRRSRRSGAKQTTKSTNQTTTSPSPAAWKT
jgi:hypothetical protein